MSRYEKLNSLLRSFQTESPDIEAAALVSEDSLMIASALPQHIEEERISGVSATLLSLGERAATEMSLGELDQVLIRGAHGYAIMVSAAHNCVFIALTTRKAKLGLIFLDMKRVVTELAKIL